MLPQSPFVALQHRNFRLLWTGQLISFSGSNMQTAALLWHVSLLVPSAQRPLALGMVGLVRLMPIVFFSIAGGTIADASDRRRVMLVTQAGMAVAALALAVPTFRGVQHPWPIYALAAVGAAVAVPAVGFIVGPLAIALTAAGAAGVAGGLLAAFGDWGVPEDRLRGYEAAVRNGAILMSVEARSAVDANAIAEDWADLGGRDIHRT